MRIGLLAIGLLALGTDESTAPRLLSKPAIPYPGEAKSLRVAGEAVFVASVDEKGTVTGVEVRAVPLPGLGFEEAVEKAVTKWRFEPAMLNGQPRAGRHEGRFSFVLQARDESAIAVTVARFAETWNGSDAGGFAATQLISDYVEADGIKVPSRRRAYTRGPDGRPVLEMQLLRIDLSEVRFA